MVFDGNSLAYRAASAWLRKPWYEDTTAPVVPALRREQRHPIHGISAAQRTMIRDILYGKVQSLSVSALQAACDSVDLSLPGFSDCMDYIIYGEDQEERVPAPDGSSSSSDGDSVHPVPLLSDDEPDGG